jgi:2-C-methyl-D-erythritol 4-phosphate cytidylyltransferase/2-C-methyl-D-erythritol 2,4-cyclodiphosphate synthase
VNNRTAAIIVAAGSASRFGSPKVLADIAGEPAIVRTTRSFVTSRRIDQVFVVSSSDLIGEIRSLLRPMRSDAPITIVEGGAHRQDSVMAGLVAAGDAGIAVVHDAARPLVTPEIIDAVLDAMESGADAAFAGIAVVDTLKRQHPDRLETVDRTDLWRAQTPQAFRIEVLRPALRQAIEDGRLVTDEVTLIEEAGGSVIVVPGDERLMKLTRPEDSGIVTLLAGGNEPVVTRTGIGYDVHQLVAGRKLVLGGIEIPHHLGLDGHSDADVLVHAIADAVLGACALGDIGQHFPPSDDSIRGIDSLEILKHCTTLIREFGATLVSIDATVIAEAPKIGPHSEAMRARIAAAVNLPVNRISIKATTNERLGFLGRQEGIAAMAIATVQGRKI